MPVVFAITIWLVIGAATAGAEPTKATGTPDGAALYTQYCQPCHGADRKGYAADNAPSLVTSTFRETADDAFLRSAIERGRSGTAMGGYGKQYGGPLGAPEINALIAYLRGGTPAKPLPLRKANGDKKEGLQLYEKHCQSCHGTAAQRATAVHLANAMFLETATNAFLYDAIVRGRPGTPMVAWGKKLSEREIDSIVTYLRSLARPVPPPASGKTLLSLDTIPIVINPKGPQAEFTLRDNRFVSVADVGKAYKEGKRLVIVDARPPSDYLHMHIEGSISIPYFDMRDIPKVPNDGTWVIAYCACPHHVSGIVMEEFRKRGYPNAAVLDEGIFVWQLQGYPTAVAPGQLPVPAPPANPAGQPAQK